jgi:hypothetical protein
MFVYKIKMRRKILFAEKDINEYYQEGKRLQQINRIDIYIHSSIF